MLVLWRQLLLLLAAVAAAAGAGAALGVHCSCACCDDEGGCSSKHIDGQVTNYGWFVLAE